ncbi:MAG TPA: hypothetical protein VN714_32775 [Trebonia sp.]|nr:hypothetical protein [Trebonia sp.]
MFIQRNRVLTALAAACVLFACLLLLARMPSLIALPIALVAGGVILAVPSRPEQAAPIASAPPAVIAPEPPPPPQYQAQPVAGIALPSARPDYRFVFSATVYWLPAVSGVGVADPGAIAKSEIIRRAREIAQRRDPADATLLTSEAVGLLAEPRPDPTNRVHVRAELALFQLSEDDRRRLEELARLRKEEELWDYQRRQEQSKRRYLGEDVLRNSGSAVVWWLARNDSQPEKVADSIGALTRLANAANNADDVPADDFAVTGTEARAGEPTGPQTPAEQFGAFLDSLSSLDDDARLLITKQMASMVESHGYAAVAREMTGPYDEEPGGTEAGSGLPGDEQEPGGW